MYYRMVRWLPGFERAGSKKEAGGTFNDSPKKFVCHTTEGFSRDPLAAAKHHTWPPHFWVTLPSHPYSPRRKIQIVPLDRSAFALAHPRNTPETNKAGAIQVEIEGRASSMHELSRADLDWLTDELIGPVCAAVGIDPARWIQGNPDVNSSYGANSVTRLSWKDWAQFNGICSHQNVPGNDHWDAGGLDLAYVSLRIRESASVPQTLPPISLDEDDEMALLVLDPDDDQTVWRCRGFERSHVQSLESFDKFKFFGEKFLGKDTDKATRSFFRGASPVVVAPTP